MKILCICPIGIGNYLLFYPACVMIKRNNPDHSLFLLGPREYIKDLAAGDPIWDDLYIFDATKVQYKPIASYQVLRYIRSQKFNASLNFFPSNNWLYNLLPFLSGIPRRFGFSYEYDPPNKLSFLLTHRLNVDPSLHDAYQNCSLAEYFSGRKFRDSEMTFPPLYDKADEEWALKFFREKNCNRRIAVHPGSSIEHGMIAKRWPPQRFGMLADIICDRIEAQAFIFGGHDEAPLKQEVSSAMRRENHVVDALSLNKTAALLSNCDLCLCNDSGLMHISSCLDVPTIAIFGPTDEKRNGPLGKKSLVVRKEMAGFPIWTAKNVGNRTLPKGVEPTASLDSLSVDDAWLQIEEWLKKINL